MSYVESKNIIFLKIKETSILNKGQVEFLSYLYRFGPSTTNELIDKIEKERPELKRNDLDLFDRKPAELKKLKVIKVLERRKCQSTGRLAQVLTTTNIVPTKNIKVKGTAKNILESSMNSALLAVEIYNKPRSTFKSEAYITLMIMAWTKMFHAYFRGVIGDKYFYSDKNGVPIMINEERKKWELQTCINKYGKLKEEVRKNLEFFIPLRNRIEHAHVDSRELDTVIFGECQALLMNFESFLIDNFGDEYCINESLAYSLQFSQMRTREQAISSKSLMLPQVKNIYNYIETYRKGLPSPILASQEFRVKVQLVPVTSNTSSTDLPIEFIRLEEGQTIDGKKLTTIIKDRVVEKEVVGKGTLIHTDVYKRVNEKLDSALMTSHLLNAFNFVLSIKPMKADNKPPEVTNKKYCEYHQRFKRYQYTSEYVDLLVDLINRNKVEIKEILKYYKEEKKIVLGNLLDK